VAKGGKGGAAGGADKWKKRADSGKAKGGEVCRTIPQAAMDLLGEAAVSFQLVVTKADGVKPAQLEKRVAEIEAIAKKRTAAHPLVLVTSSETGQGMAELRAELAALAAT
jgi:GTP-binding protein EngB required for normal cell division